MFTSKLYLQKKPIAGILTVFLSSILILPFQSFGQNPGYVGKRFGFSIELPVVPGISRIGDSEYSKYIENGNTISLYHNYKRARIRYRPTVSMTIVLNRKNSVEFFGRYYAPMVDIGGFDSNYVDRYGYVSTQTFIPTDRVKMKTTSFGFRYKFFRHNNLSPIGKYFSLGLEYSLINFDFGETEFTSYLNGDVLTQLPTTSKSKNLYLLAGVGKQYPMSKNLIFNLGLEFGLPINHISNINFDNENDGIFSNEEVIKTIDWAVDNASKQNYKHVYFSFILGLTLFP